MAIKRIFKTQVTDPKHWSHMTREQHLGWTGQNQPVDIGNKMIDRLYEYNYGADNIVSFIEKLPTHTIPKEGPYRWYLQGTEERNIPLAKATIDEAGSTEVTDTHKAGIAGGIFYMWYSENYFYATSVIVGDHPEQYSLRCVGEGEQVGSLYRYAVQLTTNDPNLFVPASELYKSSRWSEEYGLTEQELSIRGNSVHHASPFAMENTTSQIRKNYEVPGNMITAGENYPLNFKFVTDEGKTFDKWIPKLDWDFMTQFRRDKARLLLNGKSTVLTNGNSWLKGESGNTIKAGYGLYEQMAGGHTMYFNKFSIDNLCDFIQDITYNKFREDQRKIVLSTGSYGLIDFHKALMNKGSGYSWAQTGHNFRPSGNEVTLVEGQMTKFIWVNGIEIAVTLDPMKDDPIRNKLQHPDGGPVSSRVFDIFDFGTTNGEANIQRVKVEGSEEFYGYINGMRDAFQPYNNLGQPRQMASSKDGYSVYKQWIGGVMVKNPLKTGRYIPTMYV